MGQGQENDIGLRDVFRRRIQKSEVRKTDKGRMGLENSLPRKPPGRSKDNLRHGMTEEQPEQFLSRIAACPVYTYLDHEFPQKKGRP